MHALSLLQILIVLLLLSSRAYGAEFTPDLGQPLEVIDGGKSLVVTIPSDASERNAYPLPVTFAQPSLTEIPGKPFRQVDPAPEWPAIWKYAVYAILGFPRDAIDSTVGFFSHIPLISPVLYVGYEKIPTQILFRDPRDWHRWDGRQNKNQHGYIDGTYWGYFPSLHTWDFSYPSNWAAQRNRKINETLQLELNKRNREIEARNFQQSEALREARSLAFVAIEQGQGAEVIKRMLPAREAYPQDEGIFALYIAGLALYADEQSPDWVRPVLWRELNSAQPRALDAAEQLLNQTFQKQPNRLILGEALIYARELQEKSPAALKIAQLLLENKPHDPVRQRLVMETAVSAGESELATSTWETLQKSQLTDRELLNARFELLQGNYDAAQPRLEELQKMQPENAYFNYYLGVAEMTRAKATSSREDYNNAFKNMEQAALQAPNAALRSRAGQALAYLRGIMAGIQKKPELFSENQPASQTSVQPAPK